MEIKLIDIAEKIRELENQASDYFWNDQPNLGEAAQNSANRYREKLLKGETHEPNF